MAEINFAEYDAFSFDFDGILADSIGTHTQAGLLAFKAMANLTGNPAFASIPSELQAEAHQYGSNPMAIIGWLLRESGIASILHGADGHPKHHWMSWLKRKLGEWGYEAWVPKLQENPMLNREVYNDFLSPQGCRLDSKVGPVSGHSDV